MMEQKQVEQKINRRILRKNLKWVCEKCGSSKFVRIPRAKNKFGKYSKHRKCAKCGNVNVF